MSPISLLCIGNSFSIDALFYLHAFGRACGEIICWRNLYLPACSLKTHAENLEAAAPAYTCYETGVDGVQTQRDGVQIQQAMEGEWDYIIFQQYSADSGRFSTYFPYLHQLAEAARARVPKARLLLHQTWAYETGSSHAAFAQYGCDQRRMHEDLRVAYTKAFLAAKMDGLIPCGDAFALARETESIGDHLCKDGFHCNDLGRYLCACVWFGSLTGLPVVERPYLPESAVYPPAVNKTLAAALQQCAQRALEENPYQTP